MLRKEDLVNAMRYLMLLRAGLAIADSLKANSRIFNQGIRNLNDGQSLLSIADSAIENLSDIVIRLEELAAVDADQDRPHVLDVCAKRAQVPAVARAAHHDQHVPVAKCRAGARKRAASCRDPRR